MSDIFDVGAAMYQVHIDILLGRSVKDVETFKQLHECTFTPDPRRIELVDRIKKYHDDVEHLSLKDSIPYSIELSKWVKINGYTREEFNRAKRGDHHQS